MHRPPQPVGRDAIEVFDVVEQARVEVLGARHTKAWDDIWAKNLSSDLASDERYQRRPYIPPVDRA